MNNNTIVTAFKQNLENRKTIDKKANEIGHQFTEITSLINSVKDTYCVVFKRLSGGGKVEVCEIEDIFNPRHNYYSDDGDKKIKLFLSSEGFAISRGGNMVKNIHKVGSEKDFIRALNRFVKYKNQIWGKIKQVEKKEKFSKFIKGYEDNNLHLLFDDLEDYHYFKTELAEEKIVYYYDELKINEQVWKKMAIDTQNPNDIKLIDAKNKRHSYMSNESVYLNDMEKLEQIYDEVISFMDSIIEHQNKIRKALQKFKENLTDNFARELIMDRLAKDEREAQ